VAGVTTQLFSVSDLGAKYFRWQTCKRSGIDTAAMRSCQLFMMHSFHTVLSENLRQYSLTLSIRNVRAVKTARRGTSQRLPDEQAVSLANGLEYDVSSGEFLAWSFIRVNTPQGPKEKEAICR